MQFYHADFFPLAKMERNIYLENNKRRENIHNIFAFCLKGFSSVAAIACIQSDYSCRLVHIACTKNMHALLRISTPLQTRTNIQQSGYMQASVTSELASYDHEGS